MPTLTTVSFRRWPALLAVGPLAASLSLAANQSVRSAAGVPVKIGAPVGPVTFRDVTGRSYSLADLRHRKAVVLIFLSTECPVSNSYGPRLQEIDKEYSPRGVAFFGVNSNWQESLTVVIQKAK